MFIETNSKYGSGFQISSYKGKISLIAARQYNDKVYHKWGEIEIGKDKIKRLPVVVELGDGPEEALKTLRAVAEFIKAGKYEKAGEDKGGDSEAPF